VVYYSQKGGERVDDLKDILSIAKDLLQIVVLILTAVKLMKKDKPKRSKPKRKRGK